VAARAQEALLPVRSAQLDVEANVTLAAVTARVRVAQCGEVRSNGGAGSHERRIVELPDTRALAIFTKRLGRGVALFAVEDAARLDDVWPRRSVSCDDLDERGQQHNRRVTRSL